MDVYFCSTVRHLLFALTRALYEKEKKSAIYISIEQQAFSEDNFHLEFLPNNIKCFFLYRSELKRKLKSSFSGRVTYFLSKIDAKYDGLLSRYISLPYSKFNLGVSFTSKDRLFLFNDRNSMAKLFRLLFPKYIVIEDGLATYNGQPLNWMYSLLFHRKFYSERFMGDDSRCTSVYLLNIEKSPEALSHKVKKINWIDPLSIKAVCFPFFGVKSTDFSNDINHIIATQPISFNDFTNDMLQVPIYEAMINKLLSDKKEVYLKVHPREKIEPYQQLNSVTLLPTHLPLELILLSQNEKCNIYSIYSSAGMGFEEYCNRITLFNDCESKYMAAALKDMALDVNLVKEKFDARLKGSPYEN